MGEDKDEGGWRRWKKSRSIALFFSKKKESWIWHGEEAKVWKSHSREVEGSRDK